MVDLILIALIVMFALNGYRQGFLVGALSFVGFLRRCAARPAARAARRVARGRPVRTGLLLPGDGLRAGADRPDRGGVGGDEAALRDPAANGAGGPMTSAASSCPCSPCCSWRGWSPGRWLLFDAVRGGVRAQQRDPRRCRQGHARPGPNALQRTAQHNHQRRLPKRLRRPDTDPRPRGRAAGPEAGELAPRYARRARRPSRCSAAHRAAGGASKGPASSTRPST